MSDEYSIPLKDRKQVIGVTEDGRLVPLGVTQSIREDAASGDVVVTLSMAFPSEER